MTWTGMGKRENLNTGRVQAKCYLFGLDRNECRKITRVRMHTYNHSRLSVRDWHSRILDSVCTMRFKRIIVTSSNSVIVPGSATESRR